MRPGRPIPREYSEENLAWLDDGAANLLHHIETVRKAGVNPVVCINAFHTDTRAETELVVRRCEEAGARVAVSEHWRRGGEGAQELADAVLDACEERVDFRFLYEPELPLRQRVERIAREVYGASGVSYSAEAAAKAERFESDPKFDDYATMMVKTHLSLSQRPLAQGRAERLDPAGPGLPRLRGGALPLPGRGRHLADARHRFGPGLPPDRHRHRDRKGQGPVLKVVHREKGSPALHGPSRPPRRTGARAGAGGPGRPWSRPAARAALIFGMRPVAILSNIGRCSGRAGQ